MRYFYTLLVLFLSQIVMAQHTVTANGDIYSGFDSLAQLDDSNSTSYLYFDQDAATLYIGDNDQGNATYTGGRAAIIAGTGHEVSGEFSSVFGINNISRVNGGMTFGSSNHNEGINSVIWGSRNKIDEFYQNLNTIWGDNNTVKSSNTTVWGYDNTVQNDANRNTVWGNGNESQSEDATIWGKNNNNSGSKSTLWGENNSNLRPGSTISGLGNIGAFNNVFVTGTYNDASTANTINGFFLSTPLDHLFVVGNGTSLTNRSNAMVVTKNGRIGIGMSSPQAALDIAEGTIILKEDILINHYNVTSLGINSSIIPTENNRDLGNSVAKWRNIYATNGVIQTSDIRLKKDITPVNDVLEKLLQLEPIHYHMIEGDDGHLSTGLSAQAVESLFPEVVSKSTVTNKETEDVDQYGIRYTELIPIVIKAIQEQQAIIEKQQKLINQLLANQPK